MALNKKARCLNGDIFKESSLLWLVRWYGRYALYYADLKEMAAERGLKIERSKICRWVHEYGAMLAKLIKPPAKRYN